MTQGEPAGANPQAHSDHITLARSEYHHLQNDLLRIRTEREALRQERDTLRTELAQYRPEKIPAYDSQQHVATTPQRTFPPEEERDPPDYEKERHHHPHQLKYRTNGRPLLLSYGWQVIGASQRGRSHANSKWREDDFRVRPFAYNHGVHQGVAVCIGDGISSNEFSRWGARAAVCGAVHGVHENKLSMLTKLVQGTAVSMPDRLLAPIKGRTAPPTDPSILASQILLAMLQNARKTVTCMALRRQKNLHELGSTLLLFIAIPHEPHHLFIASAQIGDGALYARDRDRGDWSLLEIPQSPRTSNKVQPFMDVSPDNYGELIHVVDIPSAHCILAMTDGTQDDLAWAPDKNNRFIGGIRGFYEELEAKVDNASKPANGLLEFLNYPKQGSRDDRTVVCVRYIA